MAQEHTIAFGPFRLETPPGRFGVGGGHAGIGRGVGSGRAARGRVDGPGRGRDAGGRDRGSGGGRRRCISSRGPCSERSLTQM